MAQVIEVTVRVGIKVRVRVMVMVMVGAILPSSTTPAWCET